mgnify:CR=1 FL=1
MGLSKDIIIKNKYIIKHKIGQGNFGKIFLNIEMRKLRLRLIPDR